jgi:hypothetical protein
MVEHYGQLGDDIDLMKAIVELTAESMLYTKLCYETSARNFNWTLGLEEKLPLLIAILI